MSITPKNWDAFQHYKDRSPAWIKLHRGLLDDYAFSCLPVASRALAPLLWLLASEYEGGKITASNDEIAFRFRMTEKELLSALKPLIEKGFFIVASALLADCKQDAIPEKEREIEEQEEKEEDIRAVAVATRPSVDPFEEFWKSYPKRDGANPKQPARKKYLAAVRSGIDPREILAAVKRFAEEERKSEHIGTPYVAQAVTWLNQQRWGDYAPQAQRNSAIGQPPSWAPTEEELRRRYGQRDQASGVAKVETSDNSAAERPDKPRELLSAGADVHPRELRGGQSPDCSSRHAGMRSLGEILPRALGLGTMDVDRSGAGRDRVDDAPDTIPGVVR